MDGLLPLSRLLGRNQKPAQESAPAPTPAELARERMRQATADARSAGKAAEKSARPPAAVKEAKVSEGGAPPAAPEPRRAEAPAGASPPVREAAATTTSPVQQTQATAAGQAEPRKESTMSQTLDKSPAAEQQEPAAQLSMTVLSPAMKMRGAEIDTEEDVTIHGSYDGKLKCRHLIVSPGASVSGEIVAQHARVSGTLSGNIRAENMLVFKGATLAGDVKAKSLGMQPGCKVKASIDCDQTEEIPSSVPMPAVAPARPAPVAPTNDADFSASGFLRLVAQS